MNFRKSFAGLAISALAAMSQAQAAELLFDSLGDTGTLLYSQSVPGATLGALVDFTLTSWTSSTATFAVKVANTSFGDGTNTLMSLGIDVVSPTLSGADASGIWDAGVNTNFPSFQRVDLCIYSSNGCSGGNINNGLNEGLESIFTLTLNTSGNFSNGISFISPYSIKFQGAGTLGDSYEFAGCIKGTDGCGGNGTPVPEPASLALVGLGLGLAGLARRRQESRRAGLPPGAAPAVA